jgi:hypothetical protein
LNINLYINITKISKVFSIAKVFSTADEKIILNLEKYRLPVSDENVSTDEDIYNECIYLFNAAFEIKNEVINLKNPYLGGCGYLINSYLRGEDQFINQKISDLLKNNYNKFYTLQGRILFKTIKINIFTFTNGRRHLIFRWTVV